jgi:putative ABC transport system permease protein
MKAIVLKLVHDLWRNKIKLVLCILAAGLSSWGISSVIFSYTFSTRDFHRNFTATSPADIVVTINDATDSLVSILSKIEGVSGVERREAIPAKIRNHNNRWIPMLLFGVENFDSLRFNKFVLKYHFTEDFDGIFIERKALSFLDAAAEEVIIQTHVSDSLILQKIGIVHDPGLAPAQMEQVVYGYVPLATVVKFFPVSSKRFLIKTSFKEPTEEDLKALGEEISTLVTAHGGTASIFIPPWGEHPHQGIVDGISFLQKTFGAVVSLLGVILLSLVLLIWILTQLPQVGVMKALGASNREILASYLLVLCILMSIGLSLGIPLGHMTAQRYNRFIAFAQNFEVVKDGLSIWIYLLIAGTCMVIPLIFTLSSIKEISRASVNAAINVVFSSVNNFLFKATRQIPINSKMQYAVNNLWRNPQRSLLISLLLACGIALFFTGNNLEYSIKKDFKKTLTDHRYNVMAILTKPETEKLTFLDSLPFVDKVSYVFGEIVQYESADKGYEESGVLRTFSADYNFNETFVLQGKLDRRCQDCFYVNQRMTEDFKNIQIGDSLLFTGKDGDQAYLTFSGIIKDPGGMGLYRFSTLTPETFTIVAMNITDLVDELKINQLANIFRDHHVNVAHIYSNEDILAGLESHLSPTYIIIQYMGIFTMSVALLGLVLVLNISLEERTREIGILKSLGCSWIKITQLVRKEFLMLTIISLVMGLGLVYLLTNQLCSVYGRGLLGIGFPPGFNWLLIVVSIACIFMLQATVVTLYCHFKIKAATRRLLTE